MGKRSRFGDRSYREHCRRELRFPTTFKTHQLTLDEALETPMSNALIELFDY